MTTIATLLLRQGLQLLVWGGYALLMLLMARRQFETASSGMLLIVVGVAVGAYNVGRISAAFDPGWITNRRGSVAETRRYDPPRTSSRGDEIMTFHLGSTVVLVFEPDRVELAPDAAPDRSVRLGQAIARTKA